jgi:hypothetical protein
VKLVHTPLIVFVIHVPPSSFYRSIFRGAPDNVKETYRGSRVTVAIVNMQRRNNSSLATRLFFFAQLLSPKVEKIKRKKL